MPVGRTHARHLDGDATRAVKQRKYVTGPDGQQYLMFSVRVPRELADLFLTTAEVGDWNVSEALRNAMHDWIRNAAQSQNAA